mgnify:CR=1 FL=1
MKSIVEVGNSSDLILQIDFAVTTTGEACDFIKTIGILSLTVQCQSDQLRQCFLRLIAKNFLLTIYFLLLGYS